jgi:hypothetical protein
MDITHQERIARGAKDNVGQMYIDKQAERERDAARLSAAIAEYKQLV